MFRAILFTCLLVAVSAFWVPKSNQRIVGGYPVEIEERPFQISLHKSNFHYCGGAIINEDTILTAAHCATSWPNLYEVRAGSKNNVIGGQTIGVKSIVVHPNYNQNELDWDVAILKLDRPLVLSKDVQPIKLAPRGHTIKPGASLVVSGWGTLSSGGPSPKTLYQVEVPSVDQQVCINAYGASSITDNMICAGIGEKDSCQGDSGGPLTDGDLHVGIVSWGRGCALPGYPGVYASTAALRDFIDENM